MAHEKRAKSSTCGFPGGDVLKLLACSEVYLSETANATFEVLCSE
jgi:hypothetical protein